MATIGQQKAAREARKASGGTGQTNPRDFVKQADGTYVNRNTQEVSPYQGRPSAPTTKPTVGSFTEPVLPKSNVISSQNLAPVEPLQLPNYQTQTYGGLQGATEAIVQQNAQQQKKQPTAQENYIKALMESGNISSSVDRSEQDKAKQESDKYMSMLEQEQLANRRRIEKLQKNETGMLESGLIIEQDRLNRESLSKQADIAILQTAANRNYDTAAAIADRAVEMKLEQSRANLEALKLLDSREYGEIQAQKEREYKILERNENAIAQLKLNVAQYGGGAGLLAKLSAIDTSKPGAYDQALAIAGKYAGDPLDRAIKQAQLSKLNQDATTLTEGLNTTAEAQEQDKISKLLSLSVKGTFGKGTAVGASRLTRGLYLSRIVPGPKKDFIADTKQIMEGLTLDKLAEAKGKGVTFGSLTESERKGVAASASAIAGAIKQDKNGNEYVDITQKKFDDEISKITNYAILDYERRTGKKYVESNTISEEDLAQQYSQAVEDLIFSPLED